MATFGFILSYPRALTEMWGLEPKLPVTYQMELAVISVREQTGVGGLDYLPTGSCRWKGVKLSVRYAGTPSTMESEAAVGMIRRNCQPAATNKSRNCFSVRSHPPGKISIWRSRNLPGESLPG